MTEGDIKTFELQTFVTAAAHGSVHSCLAIAYGKR